MSDARLTFSGGTGSWRIEGELDRDSRSALQDWSQRVAAAEIIRDLDLAGVEIVDASGAAAAVDAIRLFSQRSQEISISHAPHLLAHTLYRIGLLEAGSHITLIEPRQEEPYG